MGKLNDRQEFFVRQPAASRVALSEVLAFQQQQWVTPRVPG